MKSKNFFSNAFILIKRNWIFLKSLNIIKTISDENCVVATKSPEIESKTKYWYWKITSMNKMIVHDQMRWRCYTICNNNFSNICDVFGNKDNILSNHKNKPKQFSGKDCVFTSLHTINWNKTHTLEKCKNKQPCLET